jgi:hypothetical protein
MNEAKIEANKKLIGKTVRVLDEEGIDWIGSVVSVEDESTFKVTDGEMVCLIDIFNIRSVD